MVCSCVSTFDTGHLSQLHRHWSSKSTTPTLEQCRICLHLRIGTRTMFKKMLKVFNKDSYFYLEHLLWCWTLDVSRTASYEITLVRLSVRPSLSFLIIGSLVFSDMVHHDSCPSYIVNQKARFLKRTKEKGGEQISAKEEAKVGPKTRFFPIFSSLFHYFSFKLQTMIACNYV